MNEVYQIENLTKAGAVKLYTTTKNIEFERG
jgi:hypothetical protein